MVSAGEAWFREAQKLTPPGYSDEEWAEHKRQTEDCRRGWRATPPPVRIHLPDGRLHFTMEYIDGTWQRIDPPEPVKIPPPPRPSSTFVYFIGGDEGPIKIGVAADPQSRLKTIQVGNHVRLRVLADIKGGFDEEKEFHRRFVTHRVGGEWFERHPDILAEIERLNAPHRWLSG